MAVMGPAEDMSLSDFKSVYDLDVFAMFTCSKAAFRPMAEQKRGNVINIASMCGMTVLVPQEHATYNSAKAAVIMLTKSLAVEWAPFNIRVNAICPGYMMTPPVVQLQKDDPDRWNFWMSKVPMGRAGQPRRAEGHRGLSGRRGVGLHDRQRDRHRRWPHLHVTLWASPHFSPRGEGEVRKKPVAKVV